MVCKPGSGGRPRKADEIKIATGTYRADRDGDLDSKPKATGKPRRPGMQMQEARDFWDRHVPLLVEMGVAKQTDAAMLQVLCESWALLRRATKALNSDPMDKNTRIAWAEYSRQFTSAAAAFGLDPSSRSRITVDKPAKPAIKGRERA